MVEAGKTITALVVMEDEVESNKVLWMFELEKFVEIDAKLVEQWELGMCVKSDAWTIESKDNRIFCTEIRGITFIDSPFAGKMTISSGKLGIKTTIFDENILDDGGKRLAKTCRFGKVIDEFKRLPEIGDFSLFYVSIVCMRRPNDFYLYWAISEILKYEPEYAIHMFVDCFGIVLQNEDFFNALYDEDSISAVRFARYFEKSTTFGTYPELNKRFVSTLHKFNSDAQNPRYRENIELSVILNVSVVDNQTLKVDYSNGAKTKYVYLKKSPGVEMSIRPGKIVTIKFCIDSPPIYRNLDYRITFSYENSSGHLFTAISILYTYRDGVFHSPFLKYVEADEKFHDFYAHKLNKVGIVYARVLNYRNRNFVNWKFVDPTSLKTRLGHPDPESCSKDKDEYQEKIAKVAKYYIDEWHAFNSAKAAQVFFSALRTDLR
ncbi:hypothetical protein WR25_15699 [Diploscapter pachys]|uniref:Uncharacterized protein n=1 Tax=Diploscapter pachys TaxID=2018661 RepID=A0A2A2J357_9BILA|nr:hypothetical protein WR25_15699 [Diploscapter pachys]